MASGWSCEMNGLHNRIRNSSSFAIIYTVLVYEVLLVAEGI
jgi:hypothetical protein